MRSAIGVRQQDGCHWRAPTRNQTVMALAEGALSSTVVRSWAE